MMWLAGGEKKIEDIFIRFDRIHERDRQTDRRTDGHRTTAYAALTHSCKNHPILMKIARCYKQFSQNVGNGTDTGVPPNVFLVLLTEFGLR